ncbi:MAG: hypothetical protein A3K19_31935 [Lentisphaerae bacterium RIFOXYB12_FULL_65_16]|nr:MAG: hypothetical protein A3K53_09870 [Deltaproteobacteria bacterium RIFOXYB2_FULL_66_7]OGV78635.1 MAG: hypothetical protein A3K18_10715 [Lentisphaerae bacterium RIFOXYA12_64_32]OGV88712.1 MAG: hypothetical protein A3K19_31935 [Lentisphaerae bacterium RIFOXYB12_FULL_65_16]
MSLRTRPVRCGGGLTAIALLGLFWCSGALLAGDGPRVRPLDWAQPVLGTEIGNFYCVDKDVYRSEQPNGEGMRKLESLGFKSVLNLRGKHTDDNEAKGASMKLYLLSVDADQVKGDELRQALDIIREAPKPILVHCWHGSDRTGLVIAAYRMGVQNWSRENAADELINGGFGFHKSFYPNIVEYLKAVDPAKFR